VISAVADRASESLRKLIYLDALLLEGVQSIFSSLPKVSRRATFEGHSGERRRRKCGYFSCVGLRYKR
jgi:hypothetical protein